MSRVTERERSGASALNYLVAFSAQAVRRWPPAGCWRTSVMAVVLAGSALLAAGAAGLFSGIRQFAARRSLARPTRLSPVPPDGTFRA